MPGDGRDGAKVADHRNLRPDLLEVCTHTPGRGKTAIDVYTTFEWGALCREVGKLKIGR